MTAPSAEKPVPWVAVVSPVREVSLLGAASLALWTNWLRPEGLFPTNRDGRAEIMLSATDARYMGVRFRELSISVAVCRQADGSQHEGYFLVHAVNSVRLFAWVERTLFHTPYYHAQVVVDTGLPAAIQATSRRQLLLSAALAVEPGHVRTPVRDEWSRWEGPIYLPRKDKGPGQMEAGSLFVAKLEGQTQTYLFTDADQVTFGADARHSVWQQLRESRFVGCEWTIRTAATHAKSKTIRRG